MSTDLPEGDDVARIRVDKTRVLALVAKLAAERGIRVLAVGGPVFAAQGLISPRLSRSASVIVDIATFDDFMTAVLESGWRLSPLVRRPAMLPSVVLVLQHPDHVVKLDVYTAFPGFYIEPKRAFAILWSRRQVLTLHGTKVQILDRLSMVIMAVHDRLGPQSWSAKEHSYDRYLIEQFRLALKPQERKELLALVQALAAVEPMRPLLGALGLDAGEITLPNEVYARWRLSVPSASPAVRTLLALVECPPQRRLAQSLRVIRQSPGTVASALLGSPRALWLIATSRRRMRAVYRGIKSKELPS
ncbi:hypothetical protein [Parafrigoribacterium soli]|uniref:hypothetical protein n=1 Tax=Parafrigoribacterium soli TaxID=3144663 RepID=UPI0032EB63D4